MDFDPIAVRHARRLGFDVVFGDATDPEFIAHLPLARTQWAISAVPHHETGVTHDDPHHSLIRSLADLDFNGRTAVAAYSDDDAEALRVAGSDLVLMPFRDAASQAAALVLGEAHPASGPPPGSDGQKEFAS